MRDALEAFAQVPEDHLGILIGFTAVAGGLFVGLVLGGIGIWRGISLQGRLAETRSQLIVEMLHAGMSSSEILAVLDHPSMCETSASQRKQTREMVQSMVGKPLKPAKMMG